MPPSSRRPSESRSARATNHSHSASRPTSVSPTGRRGQPYPSDPPRREQTMEGRSPKRARPDSPTLPPSGRAHAGQPLPSIYQLNPDLPPVGPHISVSPFQRPQQHTPGPVPEFLQGHPGPSTPYSGPAGGHYFGLSGPSPGPPPSSHERSQLDRPPLQQGSSMPSAQGAGPTPEQSSLSLSGGPDSDHEHDDEGQGASMGTGGDWRRLREGTVGGTLFGPEDPPKKKRRRQALSCTECKRRKIKCDRLHPCGPCSRRGEPAKCVWHIMEPVEKYVTRTEWEDLLRRYHSLEERFARTERMLLSLHPELSAPPGLEYPIAEDRRGSIHAMPPVGMGLAGPGMMGVGPPPSASLVHHPGLHPISQPLPPPQGSHERRPSIHNLHLHSPRTSLHHHTEHEREGLGTDIRPTSSGEGAASSSRYTPQSSRSPRHPPPGSSPTWRSSGRT